MTLAVRSLGSCAQFSLRATRTETELGPELQTQKGISQARGRAAWSWDFLSAKTDVLGEQPAPGPRMTAVLIAVTAMWFLRAGDRP